MRASKLVPLGNNLDQTDFTQPQPSGRSPLAILCGEVGTAQKPHLLHLQAQWPSREAHAWLTVLQAELGTYLTERHVYLKEQLTNYGFSEKSPENEQREPLISQRTDSICCQCEYSHFQEGI